MINGHDTGPQDKYEPCNIPEQLKTQNQFAEQLYAEQMKPCCQILEVLVAASQFTFTHCSFGWAKSHKIIKPAHIP